ncbi:MULTISPECIES: hypothetical protein [unclassified Streptomyces]|uniref:hypothetical protein n=1 Tax=unclassified Streptomyces TaxID=2593676 RepID=UPI00044948B6|nr:hypothetical protein [Streptomyces sp. PCS3-D2]WKV70230.1 hypothetical protein AW27_001075 [Streptomyces sp. PCS3-D2]
MRTVRRLAAGLLAAAAALAVAGTAAGTAIADTPSPSATPGKDTAGAAAPTEAGTSFRTATPLWPGQKATAGASSGDYLYWVLPVDAQQRVTVKADVTLPESAARHGTSTWRLDVYDGLRRRQACTYGMQSRAAAKEAASVELSCTLRTVRAGAEPWANDPLPGSYYVRLTVVDLPEEDLGLPVRVAVEADAREQGGAFAVDGALAEPLVAGTVTGSLRDPEDGWSGGWWSDRWLWTAAGGVLGALAGIFGYSLTRGRGRPSRVPPGA